MHAYDYYENNQHLYVCTYNCIIILILFIETTMDYNLDIQSDIGSEFMINGTKALELMSNRALTVWLYPDIIYFMYCKIFGLENAYKLTKKLPRLMTEKKKNEYAHNAIDKNTIETSENDDKKKRSKALVDLLLETNKVGGNLSNEDIIDEVLTIIGAGYETTTSTVGFCILLLAIDSDIQERVYDEIHSVLGDGNETITIEHTTKLVYMKQVINETLRLFPIAPLMLRELQADVTIISGNHTLPKGTACVISPMVTHFIPELYSNPELFNPDNFNADNVAKRHKYSFIPFSGGPRSCIGMKYALLNITVLLTQILRNFSVHTDLKFSDIKLKFNLTIKSVNGYPVTIRPRNSALVTS
ncbi:Hypothetical protein CINCED_3A017723 [Cinara cedri]|uniref:Cytochrome P450, E-class, group I,Cytochrome P450,Cytochrome P450, conserved site n=1 Tax=Cinara cedri TaxID=506608 RepID=A0A5E4NKG9_9HEMI|nr:Hypothetical protein CINCED_3A017723 [Cinara cedri]